jgi:hypothetical protein
MQEPFTNVRGRGMRGRCAASRSFRAGPHPEFGLGSLARPSIGAHQSSATIAGNKAGGPAPVWRCLSPACRIRNPASAPPLRNLSKNLRRPFPDLNFVSLPEIREPNPPIPNTSISSPSRRLPQDSAATVSSCARTRRLFNELSRSLLWQRSAVRPRRRRSENKIITRRII